MQDAIHDQVELAENMNGILLQQDIATLISTNWQHIDYQVFLPSEVQHHLELIVDTVGDKLQNDRELSILLTIVHHNQLPGQRTSISPMSNSSVHMSSNDVSRVCCSRNKVSKSLWPSVCKAVMILLSGVSWCGIVRT